MSKYPKEEHYDEYMDDSVTELRDLVVGHKIVSVNDNVITLDNGKTVTLLNGGDCCAYTTLEGFLLNPELVDHLIMGVATTENYNVWHIYADAGDILKLDVDWDEGTGYYGYGFYLKVKDLND